MKFLAAILTLQSIALAGEYAVLRSGARLRAEKHEIEGSTVRLHSKTGVTELDRAEVVGFEAEEYVAPAAQPAAPAKPVPSTRELVEQAARKHGLPPALVHSVVRAESAYRPNAVSSKGAIGLMQLMPATAKGYGADPKDPAQNVEAGTEYLRDLLIKYDGRATRALAAYNAGPGAVDRYNGVPPYRETRSYVGRVLKNYEKLK
jgi:soluble lytic murein transglycosylase-like protein